MSSVNISLVFICFYFIGPFVIAIPDGGLKKSYYNISKANEIFKEFQEKFHKKYLNNKEYNYRFQIFRKALEDINKRNEESDGEVYGITEFADMTLDEFLYEHTGFKSGLPLKNNSKIVSLSSHSVPDANLPENWDWRSKGLVTQVRHQGVCSSCWSFSAVGCVEGQYAKKHGVLLTLSEQQLVDCYKRTCRIGDWPHEALRAAAKMGGLMLAQDYPYSSIFGHHGQCKFKKDKVYVKVTSGTQYGVRDEDHLKSFLYSYGPVAIGIKAARGFIYYRGGIATARHLGCRPGEPIDHAVLLVGYGTENGIPFWIIKNSAGKEWGEDGFIRIRRGENTCNILAYIAAAEIA
ncbi:papain family cysteine protease domain-containing protein [Phthorimaea operculella]|nr:papain family cysteine protease domain-containing protein [Phthorimaea operculella]